MNRPASKTVRRRFFVALGHAIHVTWPILSIILAIQVVLGLLVGIVVCRRRGLFHLRHWPLDWLWRYRTAAGARARTCDRNWCLRALPHGPHSGDCGLRHAQSAQRSRHRLTSIRRPSDLRRLGGVVGRRLLDLLRRHRARDIAHLFADVVMTLTRREGLKLDLHVNFGLTLEPRAARLIVETAMTDAAGRNSAQGRAEDQCMSPQLALCDLLTSPRDVRCLG